MCLNRVYKLWRKSYVFLNKAKIVCKCAKGSSFEICRFYLYNFLVILYGYSALEFNSKIEMWNKFNSFIHLVLHLPFTVAMLWGRFLRVCLKPQNTDIRPWLYNQILFLNLCSENHIAVGQWKIFMVQENRENLTINKGDPKKQSQ